MDEQTVFPLSSNTKAFTAAAIAVLVDEGKLAWDDPVNRRLPSFQPPEVWKSDVTVRDLLSHQLRRQFGYTNAGYVVAGELVAAVSGTDWADFVQSRLLQPLGMFGHDHRHRPVGRQGLAAVFRVRASRPHGRYRGRADREHRHAARPGRERTTFGGQHAYTADLESVAKDTETERRFWTTARDRSLSTTTSGS